MKTAQKIKLEDAMQNEEKYIRVLSKWQDKKLEKHLDLFRKQKELALNSKKMEAFELLKKYEDQVIQARLRKLK